MSTKVDQPPADEPPGVKMTATTVTSTASNSGTKVSMFAAKSGFVIPKNKLSGSLVPIFRGSKKPGGNDSAKEEDTKQMQRKTKWGPDLTQDVVVRKGRTLAYQTRVDQINQQLKSGTLEVGDSQDSVLATQHEDHKPSSPQNESEISEILELERREVIGEILKLNPSYKVPPDYKPLLKVARVPMPIKEHPGYNFVGLIFGPGGESIKQLEKETGAKVQVYGTKANTGEKVEISPSDGNEHLGAYEELHVHMSADTFEKVDAAVALIELLLTSVSGNLGTVSASTSLSDDNAKALDKSQDAANPYAIPAGINHGVVQNMLGSSQTPQGQFQYHGQWLPTIPSVSSVPIVDNPMHVQLSTFNPSSRPSLFGPQPASVPPRLQPPMQVSPHLYMPQTRPLGQTGLPTNFPMPSSHPSSAQPNISASLQSQLAGASRPLVPLLPQPMSSVPRGPLSDRPFTPAIGAAGWSGTPGGASASQGLSNMGQTSPLMVQSRGPRPVIAPVASTAPPTNMVSPVTFPSGLSTPHLSSAPANHPVTNPVFTSVPPPSVGNSPALLASFRPTPVALPASRPIQSSAQVMPLSSSTNPFSSSAFLRPGVPSSVTGSPANFTSTIPASISGPNPLYQNSADFTFHPHQPQNPAPRPNSQLVTQNTPPPRPMAQPPAPQAPPFRLAVPTSTPQPVPQAFPGPSFSNQIGQPEPLKSAIPFPGNPAATLAPPRIPAFPNANPVPPTPPNPQMGQRSFSSVPQVPNLAGPFPLRPGNPLQLRQNYPAPITPRGNFVGPNQRFGSNLPFASGRPVSISGGQQIYDPFSPTSVSIAPQQQGSVAKGKRQENDPEYEDLMASVGLK